MDLQASALHCNVVLTWKSIPTRSLAEPRLLRERATAARRPIMRYSHPTCTASHADRRRGAALLAIAPAMVLIMALLMAVVGSVTSSSQSHEQEHAVFDAESAARAVVALAIEDVWSTFDAGIDLASAQPWDFQLFLEAQGLPDQTGVDPPIGVDISDRIALPLDARGRPTFAGAIIEEVTAYRLDSWDSTALVVDATIAIERGRGDSSRTMRHAVQEVFTVAPPQWDGLDYALLATNINCILCHTDIDSAQRFYNLDPTLRGEFEQIKLGTIESLHFRADPSSSIAGSLYVGGEAMEGDGDLITDWAKFNLKSRKFDAEGNLVEDAWGGLTATDLQRPDEDDASVVPNFFLGEDAHSDDSFLPSSFPPPFPDNGGYDPVTGTVLSGQAKNRIVDDEEFNATVGGSNGKMSGGKISVLDPADRVDTGGELGVMRNGQGATLDGVVKGNVYLYGDKNDPLVLDGDIAVDGDIVISGYFKGSGAIRARGNVYIPSDLHYADGSDGGSRIYGTAADGTPNNLAIAAGGNIMVGDIYRPAWGTGTPTTGGKDGSFNFVMDEVAIFNRMEWIKTQPTLPGKTVKVQVGTKIVLKDEYVKETYEATVPIYTTVKTGNTYQQPIYQNVTTTTGVAPYQTSTTTKVLIGYKTVEETVKVITGYQTVLKTRNVKTGNKIEVVEPVYEWQTPQYANELYAGANYRARYYTFNEGKPAPIFNKGGYFDPIKGHWMSDERAAKWDDTKLSYANPANATDPFLYNADGSVKAIVSSLSPSLGWIAPAQMQALIALSLGERADRKDALEINATLYSANAIMGVVGKLDTDMTDGKLHVNGGLVASDIGLLAPNGTQINYDGRGAERLSITSDQGLTIRRSATLPRAKS